MTRAVREYVTLDAGGDERADYEHMRTIGDSTRTSLGDLILGHLVVRLNSVEEIEDDCGIQILS